MGSDAIEPPASIRESIARFHRNGSVYLHIIHRQLISAKNQKLSLDFDRKAIERRRVRETLPGDVGFSGEVLLHGFEAFLCV